MDIKNTKEVLVASNEIGLVIASALKDGAQTADVMLVVGKIIGELQAKISEAAEGVTEVPAEIKDLDVMEGIELAKIQLEYVPKFVAALKK